MDLIAAVNPTLLSQLDELIPVIAISGGILIALTAIIAGSIKESAKAKHREETRREVAAYVAEGTMTPADAERILTAGKSAKKCGSA